MKFTPLHDRVSYAASKAMKRHGRPDHPGNSQGKAPGRRGCRGRRGRTRRGRRPYRDGRESGDKNLFGKWSGTEIKIDGEELMIMKESDILGIMA